MSQLRVLYISPEVFPFHRLTSAAEICAGLPKYIKEYGHEIRVIMPKYKFINDHKYILRDVIRLKEVPIEINGETKIACIKSSFIPDSKVQIYFVEIQGFYTKKSFLDSKQKPTEESLKELAFFGKAVMELLKILCWYPNIFHSNDWQCGLLYYYLKNHYKDDLEYKHAKIIHSIHNLKEYGIYDAKELKQLQLESSLITGASLSRLCLEEADLITLDNEEALMDYEEDPFYHVYQTKDCEIIPHGYDDLLWNPQAKKMKQVYTIDTIEQKEVNKKYLTHKKDLELPSNFPILLIHLSMDYPKIDEIETWVKRHENKEIYIVITSIEKDLNKKYQDEDMLGENYVFLRAQTNDDLKNLLAASDFYLELCQRSYYNHRFAISCPFGTIPVGQKSDFVDQFISYDEDPENFNAILINDIEKDFDNLVEKIISLYRNNDSLIEVKRRVMSMLVSWMPSGMRIGKIYDRLSHH